VEQRQMALEQLDMQKDESRHKPYTLQKSSLKRIIDLNIKCKTVKLLEDNIGEPRWPWIYNGFLDTKPKTWSMKEIIDQVDFIKT